MYRIWTSYLIFHKSHEIAKKAATLTSIPTQQEDVLFFDESNNDNIISICLLTTFQRWFD